MDTLATVVIVVVVVAAGTLVAWRALAPPDGGSPPAGGQAGGQQQAGNSMYDRLGQARIQAAVDQFYHRVLGDPRLAHYFSHVDLARLRRHQALFIGQVLGGPAHFQMHQLAAMHSRMSLDRTTYWWTAGHLLGVLAEMGVDRDIRAHLCNALLDVEDVITGRTTRKSA